MNTPQKREGDVKRIADICRIKEYRCPVCKRLLMKGKIIVIETRCPKCKKFLTLNDKD